MAASGYRFLFGVMEMSAQPCEHHTIQPCELYNWQIVACAFMSIKLLKI